MNKTKLITAPVFILLLLALFNGCASWDASSQESLLSAAGFKTRTPSTPKQEAMFARMAPYTVERRERHGKVLYAYADKKQHLLYIGGEAEYQRYKQLGLQKSIADSQLQAAQINEDATLYDQAYWGPYWGPWNPWW
ncbi:MAG TPA: hypothetical protein VE641_11925 [Chthoniobacterales bacterium]|jgi:hypothetical protein|nr:hypothetical protein [Chthoniobacterales bacterium]